MKKKVRKTVGARGTEAVFLSALCPVLYRSHKAGRAEARPLIYDVINLLLPERDRPTAPSPSLPPWCRPFTSPPSLPTTDPPKEGKG